MKKPESRQQRGLEREKFGSRLGFILVSAGCAIGLGNVWKFPYMCGQYGGAAFILIYLLFLAILGFPIMVCEFSVGRASQKSCATSFKVTFASTLSSELSFFFANAVTGSAVTASTTVAASAIHFLFFMQILLLRLLLLGYSLNSKMVHFFLIIHLYISKSKI